MSFGYSRHAAPPASGVSVSSIEIGLYPIFFKEKILIYLHISKKSSTFAPAKVNGNERYSLDSCLVGKLDA